MVDPVGERISGGREDPTPARLSDAEILRSAEFTVRELLLPALRPDEEWARAAGVQLIGLLRYALRRGPDPTAARLDELVDVLRDLGHNSIVHGLWDGDVDPSSVSAATGAALAAAVTRDDADAEAVRSVLRPVVMRHLDEELAETGALVDAFRGKLDD